MRIVDNTVCDMTIHFVLITRRGNYAFRYPKLRQLLEETVAEEASMRGDLVMFEYGISGNGYEGAYKESAIHFAVRFIEPVNPALWVRRLKATCDKVAQEAQCTSRLWFGGCLIKDAAAYTSEGAMHYAKDRIGRDAW